MATAGALAAGPPAGGSEAGGLPRPDLAAARVAMRAFSPVPPVPPDPTNPVADDAEAAALGRRLFFDPGYARGGGVSCATCHQPGRAFADGLGVAEALGTGARNTPSLFYAGHMRWQGWGGRGDSLWAQSIAALENPKEMDGDRVAVARRFLVREAPSYQRLFGALPDTRAWPAAGRPGEAGYRQLPAAVRADVERVVARFGQALGAYVRRLEPGPAPFDRFVAGDDTAIGADAVRGFTLFAGKARCAECHAGPLMSDGAFHNIGVMQSRGAPDFGRMADLPRLLADPFNGAGVHAATPVPLPAAVADDEGRFRTPTLRNLAATAPYWHNGAFPTLGLALTFDLVGGGAHQDPPHFFPGRQDPLLVPIALADGERSDLEAFLTSLAAGPVPAPWGVAPE